MSIRPQKPAPDAPLIPFVVHFEPSHEDGSTSVTITAATPEIAREIFRHRYEDLRIRKVKQDRSAPCSA